MINRSTRVGPWDEKADFRSHRESNGWMMTSSNDESRSSGLVSVDSGLGVLTLRIEAGLADEELIRVLEEMVRRRAARHRSVVVAVGRVRRATAPFLVRLLALKHATEAFGVTFRVDGVSRELREVLKLIKLDRSFGCISAGSR